MSNLPFLIICVLYLIGSVATVKDAFHGLHNPSGYDIFIGILIFLWWPVYWFWLLADYCWHKTRERLRI